LKTMIKKTVSYLLVLVIVIVFLFPVYWTLLTSIKAKAELFDYPPRLIPSEITLKNYEGVILGQKNDSVVMGEGGYGKYLFNSVIVSVASCLICFVIGAFGAYGLVRVRMAKKRKDNLSFWILSTRMMPPVAAAIPFYIMFQNINLINSYWSIIISYITFNLPFVVWTLQGFFRDVPNEIYEAAKIDGAGSVLSFVKVILPLSAAGCIVTFIFTFIFSWNEFTFALVLSGEKTKTMPVAVASMWTGVASRWGEIATTGIVTIIPILILTFSIQKYFIKGMTFGAIK
jgi:multiple sugar transport system permease protein